MGGGGGVWKSELFVSSRLRAVVGTGDVRMGKCFRGGSWSLGLVPGLGEMGREGVDEALGPRRTALPRGAAHANGSLGRPAWPLGGGGACRGVRDLGDDLHRWWVGGWGGGYSCGCRLF